MKRAMKLIADIFGFLVGGDGIWKWILFPDRSEADKSIEAKRYQFLFIVRPVLTSFWIWVIWLAVCRLPVAIVQYLTEKGLTQGFFRGIFVVCNFVGWLFNFVISIVEGFDEVITRTLGRAAVWFPYDFCSVLTVVAIYTSWYRLTRKRKNRRLLLMGERLLKDFPRLENMIMGIYIEIPGVQKLKLSSKWERIKNNLSLIIILNFFAFYFLDLGTNFASKHFWDFIPQDLIPFTGFLCLMEAYHYLSFADIDWNRRVPDSTLNLTKLRIDQQQYAEERAISMTDEYRRNGGLVKEAFQTAEDSYKGAEEPDIAFLYQYLEEKGQHAHIDMAARLLKGENIFYASPFYKDIDACIFFPMFQTLLRQEKGLILVEAHGDLETLTQWLNEGLESVSGLKKLWNVAVLEDPVVDVDVGILPFQSIGSEQSVAGLAEFLKEVSFAVVLEASDMLVGGQETIITLAENIRSDLIQCTWLLCDWNAESMLDLFAHLLSADFTYVSATPVGAKETVISYWNVETEPNRIWNPAKRFLGLEVGIAEVAGRNQLSCTTWYGEEWMPVIDMKWIIGQYYQLYSKKIAQPTNQSKMDTQIQCGISGISCCVERESFLVVEDSCCNLYEVGRQYATRAWEKIYVHILSPNYLLRDFMKHQAETMRYDPKYIAQFAPEYVNSIRNVYLHLLRRLLEGEVSKREIYEQLNACENIPKWASMHYDSFQAENAINTIISVLLNLKMKRATGIETITQRVFSEKEECMVQELSFHITDKKVCQAFHKYFRQACFVDETGQKCYINRLMLAGHLQLKYLPGQYVTLNGKYYQVEQFLDTWDETLLVVKRASEQVVERRYYRQLRTYKWTEQDKTYDSKLIFQENGIRLTRLTMNFEATTTGYLTVRKNWKDLGNAQESDRMRLKRNYFEKQVLRVDLPTDRIERGDLFYLAAVIHDMFYTLYPQYCYLISVAVCWGQNEEKERRRYRGVLSELERSAEKGDLQKNTGEQAAEWNSFYIFEDSCEDMGLLRSIERHFRRILQIAAEYIEWESEPYFSE